MTKTIWLTDFRLPMQIDSFAPIDGITTFTPVDCNTDPALWKNVKKVLYQYDTLGRLLKQTIETP